MKANELRVGNFVYNDKNEVYEVSWINKYIERLSSPIPLTEEWLINFGSNLFPWGWVLNGILIRTNHNDKFWIELGNGKKIDLPYVHTLQNFFALTGEELTIKN